LTAGGLIEQSVYEAVGSIHHVYHQPLHFVVVQSRYFGPWNDAVWTAMPATSQSVICTKL
jgi:hypothetical protein